MDDTSKRLTESEAVRRATEDASAIADVEGSNIVADSTDRVTSAASGRARAMADTAGRTAQQAMEYTRETARKAGSRVRRNPVPLVVLLGLGAAWLVARRTSWARMRRDERESGTGWTRMEATHGEAMYAGRTRGVMARIRGNPIPAALAGVGIGWLAFAGGKSASGETRRWSSEPGGESAGERLERARGSMSSASGTMRQMMRRRRSQFQNMVQENPLLVGCGALLLGLAFGMAVPETETEKQWMGEARDTVVGRAREAARGAASQMQDAATGALADAAGKITGRPQSS